MVITRTCDGVEVLVVFAPTFATLDDFSSAITGMFKEEGLVTATLAAFRTDFLLGLPARLLVAVFETALAVPRLLLGGAFRSALRGLGGLMNMGKKAWRKAKMILTRVITSSPAMGDWASPAKRPRSASISAARFRLSEANLLSVSIWALVRRLVFRLVAGVLAIVARKIPHPASFDKKSCASAKNSGLRNQTATEQSRQTAPRKRYSLPAPVR